jgi:hypothetical protein
MVYLEAWRRVRELINGAPQIRRPGRQLPFGARVGLVTLRTRQEVNVESESIDPSQARK